MSVKIRSDRHVAGQITILVRDLDIACDHGLFWVSIRFRCLALNVNRRVHCTGRSNPNYLVESLCPTLSVSFDSE